MRIALILAGLAVCLSGCEQSKSSATEAPAPKKLASRSAQLYAGQEQILEVDAGSIKPGQTGDSIVLNATGKTASGGYYNLSFVPRINPGAPADGIYDVDVVGYRPQGGAAPAVTPVEAKGEWGPYPQARLKGVRFVAKTNNVVAMLPPAAPAKP